MPFDLATNLTPKITASGFASPSGLNGERLFAMVVEIQVTPKPSGTDENEYVFVEAAIAALEDSGLNHEVRALGTTFEGDADVAWRVIRQKVEKTLASAADSTLTHIKVAYIPRDMKSLTWEFRQPDSDNK